MKNKILSVIANVVSVFAILIAGVAIWTVLTTPKGVAPSVMGMSFMTVMTGSMEPSIQTDSLIGVKKTPPEALVKGDVISFYLESGATSGAINTHRIANIESVDGKLNFYTKGDANPVEDIMPVAQEQIVGKVVFNSHALGVIISFLKRKYVFLLVLILPLAAIMVGHIIKIIRLAKSEIKAAAEEIATEERGKDDKD